MVRLLVQAFRIALAGEGREQDGAYPERTLLVRKGTNSIGKSSDASR
jgi:hypothetical protein